MIQYKGIIIVRRASGPPPTGMIQIECQRCGWQCNCRKVDKQLLDAGAFSGFLCEECYAKTMDAEYGM